MQPAIRRQLGRGPIPDQESLQNLRILHKRDGQVGHHGPGK